MTATVKVNARNDLHLPAEILRSLNFGKERYLQAEVRGNMLILIPVDLEPRYSKEELDGLEHLHQDEKVKGWTALNSDKDIDDLLK